MIKMIFYLIYCDNYLNKVQFLLQFFFGEGWEDEVGSVDFGVVVVVFFSFFFRSLVVKWFFDVGVGVFGVDYEVDLVGGVGWDGGVGVFGDGEDFFVVLFEFFDEREVELLVFSCEE